MGTSKCGGRREEWEGREGEEKERGVVCVGWFMGVCEACGTVIG